MRYLPTTKMRLLLPLIILAGALYLCAPESPFAAMP